MRATAHGHSDRGRVRQTNQDSYYLNHDKKIFIVADGMGGHAGGEIASQLCIQEVLCYLDDHGFFAETKTDALLHLLVGSINHASAKIYEYALEKPSLKGMGTTATLLYMRGDKAYCAHVGDSRAYLIRKGFLYQLTSDHSLVNEQVRAGLLTAEEAEHHHLKNVITRSVGYQEREEVDTLALDLEDNDQLVLCSDGLYGKVTNKEIVSLINNYNVKAVPKLIDLANERGGEDNITAVVILASAQEGPRSPSGPGSRADRPLDFAK